jgi:hypothetical protein
MTEEIEKWLEETGYNLVPPVGYVFHYKDEDYIAGYIFREREVERGDLEALKYFHNEFIEKAKRREIYE